MSVAVNVNRGGGERGGCVRRVRMGDDIGEGEGNVCQEGWIEQMAMRIIILFTGLPWFTNVYICIYIIANTFI